MIKIYDKAKCCGCTACSSICPKNCIAMVQDNEGFLYPSVDDSKCIHCNLCVKVCPVLDEKEELTIENEHVFYLQIKDEKIRQLSTSGGAFAALAKSIIDENGKVYAVGYDDNMIVTHLPGNNMEDVEKMLMSKYVQSQLNDTFSKISEDISMSKKVMFIGTPCQAAGLAKYLGKNREKVLIVDLECYGVPSPLLYQKWINELETKYKKKIVNILFRDKKYGYSGVNVKIIFEDGSILEDKRDAKTFTKTMFSGIGLRPSCYDCPFRNKKKAADITLADGWSVSNYFEELDDEKGTTKIITHTSNGKQAIENVQNCVVKEVPVTLSMISNGPNKALSPKREAFFMDVNKMSYKAVVDKYLPETKKDKLANLMKPIIVKMPFSSLFFKELKKYKRRRRKSEFNKNKLNK